MNESVHNLAAVGFAIRKRREVLGLTQDRLAALAELSRVTVNELENGQLVDLGMGRVMRLLDILGYSFGLTLKQDGANAPIRNGLRVAAKTASVSYRNALPSAALVNALASGDIPTAYVAHISTLLDEAPLPELEDPAPASLKDFQADPHFKDRLVSYSLLAADPELMAPANAGMRKVLGERYARSIELFRVG